MVFCKRCVLPDTRPGLNIGSDGVCNACKGHAAKKAIDWQRRGERLEAIFSEAKKRSRGFDCIVPVSGGKDSTWQVITCMKHGLRVLAVTWRTPGRTRLGQQNLDNLICLGVDHVDYTIHPEVDKRFTRQALERTGSTGVPMHMAMFAIPLRLALAYDIPLVVWGESAHMEYGGTEEELKNDRLDHAWLRRHGILQGTMAEDWIDEELSRKDMTPYLMPPEEEFREKNIYSIFLGFYLPWDPEETLKVAAEHGFQADPRGPKIGLYNYADIDCDFISVHHHFKWLKFGFTRLFDNLAIEIRNDRMSRQQAIEIIAERGDQTPHEDIRKLCDYLGISLEAFHDIEERFRNKNIWSRINGRWVIKDFLIEDWDWASSYCRVS